jgi:hypothetical protein
MMLKTRTCTLALAFFTLVVLTPANALLHGSAPVPGNSTTKAKAATAIDRFQALIAEKAPWGIYDAAHWSAADAKLPEGRKNGKDVVSEGTIEYGSGVGNGAKGDVTFISGSTESRIFWPEGSIPTQLTICSITRYTGGANERILHATEGNWLHGHWMNRVGKAYYWDGWKTNDGWETEGGEDEHDKDWVVMCGSNGLSTPKNVLFNGAPVGVASGGSSPGRLAVNPTTSISPNEMSDWALSVVAIWDQHLAAEEMQTASDALMEYLATGRRILEPPADGPDSPPEPPMEAGRPLMPRRVPR